MTAVNTAPIINHNNFFEGDPGIQGNRNLNIVIPNQNNVPNKVANYLSETPASTA